MTHNWSLIEAELVRLAKEFGLSTDEDRASGDKLALACGDINLTTLAQLLSQSLVPVRETAKAKP